MARDARYNVRVTFINGNSITLDCHGCGQIYIEPNHDYFFEQAPIKFINYLAQLRRVGITYKITEDKRGCYRTFNLLKYEANDVGNMISKMRANRVSAKPLVEKESISEVDEVEEIPPVEEPPKGAPELPSAVTNHPDDEVPTPDDTNHNPDDESDEGNKPEEPTGVTEGTTEGSTEDTESKESETNEPEAESTPEITDEEIEAMNKKELIEYAHSLGLSEMSDIYTKKEIKAEIQKVKSN